MKIGVLDSGYESYDIERKYIRKYGFDLEVFRNQFGEIRDKIKFAQDKTGLFIRQTEIDKIFLDRCNGLKAIVRYGIGFDNIDLEEAKAHGVKVANVRDYATNCVAEHAMAMIFSCLRSIPKGESDILDRYGKPPRPDIFELYDKTLGIIGLGRIGTRLALFCSPLFGKVLANDPYITNDRFQKAGVLKSSLKDILEKSHVISIHCNLTKETHHLINAETIRQMKNKPILINTSRGPVIEEASLLKAFEENRIHSAGIDVWEDEPVTYRQQPLIDHPRVISTGHYAWYSEYSIKELQRRAALNMIGLLRNKNVSDRLI